jgi:hypothetical protein
MLSDIYRARNDYVFTRIIRPLDPAMSHWNWSHFLLLKGPTLSRQSAHS